jgi:hypothetical protein
MSAKKFVVSVERVQKAVHTLTIEADSAIEAYDQHQKVVQRLNEVIGEKNTPTDNKVYHIVKIEEVKE